MLNRVRPDDFPNGRHPTSVGELTDQMLKTNHAIANYRIKCRRCARETPARRDLMTCCIHYDRAYHGNPSDFLHHIIKSPSTSPCSFCRGPSDVITQFVRPPPLLSIVYPASEHSIDPISIGKTLSMPYEDQNIMYRLKGVVYYASNHFTSRFFAANKNVWYHDGITTGKQTVHERTLHDYTEPSIFNCRDATATLSIYSRDKT